MHYAVEFFRNLKEEINRKNTEIESLNEINNDLKRNLTDHGQWLKDANDRHAMSSFFPKTLCNSALSPIKPLKNASEINLRVYSTFQR